MKTFIRFIIFLLLLHSPAFGLSGTFPAELQLKLCPEYPLQSMQLFIRYRVGSGTEVFDANVTSQEIDTGNNTGTFQLELPREHAMEQLHVFAQCQSSFGLGNASNELEISHCDSLAITDQDQDGLKDLTEDQDCNGFFNPGDPSSLENFDTDGDGQWDVVEIFAGKDPTSQGSSPRPFIVKNAPADFDGDGEAEPVVWRPEFGAWLINNYGPSDEALVLQYGLPEDIPFTYERSGLNNTSVGVVRRTNNAYSWYFRDGFLTNSGIIPTLNFGIFGDIIIPGVWETAGVSNPALARLFNNLWTFYVYQSDQSVRSVSWGVGGDVPKVADYDGDGILDVAVYRPSEQKTYIIYSSDDSISIYDYGSATADYTVRGDYTGDGKADLVFWEPINGTYSTATSESMFNPASAISMQLGLYFIHVPMNYNFKNGVNYFTVVDHQTGLRFYRENNDPNGELIWEPWGLPTDFFG